MDLVVTDPPFGKQRTFDSKDLKPPLSEAEKAEERTQLAAWGINNPREAFDRGLEWPPNGEASYPDYWTWENKVHNTWMDKIEGTHEPLWKLIDAAMNVHSDEHAAYLAYMAVRLIEIQRILKPTGSVYLHCDHTAGHYLKLLMDAVFGQGNFRNEIVWCYAGGGVPKVGFGRKHDTILFYSKSGETQYNRQFRPYSDDSAAMGKGYIGQTLDTERGAAMNDWWTDIKPIAGIRKTHKEAVGYPTQKPVSLAERIIRASSNKGDIVLDPFAGCAYVPVAAEGLGRQWIACDISIRALTVVKRQFAKFAYSADGATIPGAGDDQMALLAVADVKVRGPGDLPEQPKAATTDPDMEDETPPPPRLPLTEKKFKGQLYSKEKARKFLLSKSGWMCWACGNANWRRGADGQFTKIESPRNFELDHIDPKDSGGAEIITNWAPLCRGCNGMKGRKDITLRELRKMVEEEGVLMVGSIDDLPDLAQMHVLAARFHAEALLEKGLL